MKRYTLKSSPENGMILLSDTGKIVCADEWIRSFEPARIFAFYAPMGTGKTTFIQWLCKQMGVEDIVNSPTFAIVNVYDLPGANSKNNEEVYHFDCYRLKTMQEAIDLGAEEYLYSGNYCFIEWPEIIEPILPKETIHIHIETLINGDRLLQIND